MTSASDPSRLTVRLPRLRVVALLFATGCGAGSPSAPAREVARSAPPIASAPPARACAVDGTVRDDRGAPVAGALVAIVPSFSQKEAALVRSDAAGAFCVQELPDGEYGLTATAPDATSAYVDVFPVAKGHGHGLAVALGGPGFVVSGQVLDEGGKPRQRTVYLPRADDFAADLFVAQTDSAGRFRVKLPAATYHAVIAADDATAEERLEVTRDRSVTVSERRMNPRNAPPPREVTEWAKANAVPIASASPGAGAADLARLGEVVGPARLVALGEATHGTREFFQIKHRALAFSVERLGFTAFLIEASFPETMALDAYVTTGKGDPSACVASMGFWTWDTEEVVELARWMRRYNEDPAHPKKLRFLGVDMQMPAGSAIAVADALAVVDPKLWDEVAPALEPLDDDWSSAALDEGSSSGEPAAIAARDRARDAAKRLAARFDERRATDVARLGAERWALARVHAHVLVDFVEMVEKRGSDPGVRDRAMADNALRLLEMLGPASKAVLWAHNGHVQKWAPPSQTTMGRVLAQRMGAGFVALGFAFDRGSFQALEFSRTPALGPIALGAAPPGTLDGALATVGLPMFLLDLRSAAGAAGAWVRTPTAARTVGSVYSASTPDAFFVVGPPAEQFDGVFFVADTTPARPAGPQSPPKGDPPRAALANGDFEEGEVGKAPPAWHAGGYPRSVRASATVVDRDAAHGRRALAFGREPAPIASGLASLVQQLDAEGLRGRRVRVTAQAAVRARGVGDEVFLMARTEGARSRSASRPVAPSRSWQPVELEIDVPADAKTLALGFIVAGDAHVRIDDVSVATVGPTPR